MKVKDKTGSFADVVIGYDNPDAYYNNPTSCGECVGRNANRIGGAAALVDRKSGRRMDVYTDLPGMQFYTGNGLSNRYPGKDGADYTARTGVCFETQFFPDAVNKADWQKPVFRKDEPYRSVTVYSFSIED